MNKILDSTNFVVQDSRSVKINRIKVSEFSKIFKQEETNDLLSQAPFDFSGFSDDERFRFTLIFQSINFCYWGDPKWTIEHDGKLYDGAWGMVVALGQGIRDGFPLLDFRYCSKITKDDLGRILRANTEIPLFEERWRILQEIGLVMLSKYEEGLTSLVANSNSDAARLLDVIVRDFPSFRDSSSYRGREVFFQKRAQLLITDLCQMLKRQGVMLKNIDQLTACADYKLPQIIRRLGILEYADQLAKTIDSKIELPHGSDEEVEIRANTIWAVEYMKEEIQRQSPDVTSMEIDGYLWQASQEKPVDEKPYHRTRTTAY